MDGSSVPVPPPATGAAEPPGDLPAEAWVAALAGLDHMGPRRLHAVLADRHPADAWQACARGLLGPSASPVLLRALGRDARRVLTRWRRQAAAIDVAERWRAHQASGLTVVTPAAPGWPERLRHDPEPPAVLFALGDVAAVGHPSVAIVGTRACTRYGYDVARRLGAELADRGVRVVSGLALGIDGAALAGALDAGGAPPVAVVGSGLDRPYPRRHADLWRRVAEAGVVLGEYPLGAPPVAWHFPARNRLIAALADVVVVVESAEAGGSMHTVDAAIDRDVDVMAVPGPVTAPASAGPNRLLSEGRAVVRDALDVLVALGLTTRAPVEPAGPGLAPPADPVAAVLLDAFDWQPASLDQLVLRTGLGLTEAAAGLAVLLTDGWIDQRGGWYERVARR
jgi:DNA processing protein